MAALLGSPGTAGHDSVRAALALAESLYRDVVLVSGEPALGHAVGTATLVSELKLDGEAIAAALLAPVAEVGPAHLRAVKERCGEVVAELVEGVAKMAQIHALSSRSLSAPAGGQAAQLEALRKMLLAMVQDTRVVLVKLADHTQELRFAVRSEDAASRRETA